MPDPAPVSGISPRAHHRGAPQPQRPLLVLLDVEPHQLDGLVHPAVAEPGGRRAAAAAVLLFALHLTNPVRQLQKAVDRFGHGDLTARVGSTRRDELGELARTFDRMADRTQTLLAAERRLLLDISHELRSPLARLDVAVELARSGDDSESQLNRIQKEADRLNALVGELLQVTRAEGDPSQRKLEPVQLDSLVTDVVQDSRIEADARGVKVELAAPARLTLSRRRGAASPCR